MESLVILQALSHIKEQRKGQNLENVVSHCCKEFDWERPKVLRAVNHATQDELISQTSKDDVALLRISDKGHQLLRNQTASVDTSVKGTSQSTADDSDLDTDYLDFKKYIHAEVLSLKALMSNRTISAPEKNAQNPRIDYETNFIKSLQDRILSLERQLDQKQEIIKKLLEGKEFNRPSPTCAKNPTGPARNTEAQSRSDKEKKGPLINNSQQGNKNSATASANNNGAEDVNIVPEDSTQQKKKKKKNKNKGKSDKNIAPESENNTKTTIEQTGKCEENKQTKILIVGDSQLRELNIEQMSNDHHVVEKKVQPGMKIKEAVRKTGKTDSNVIIVHAATNNVSKQTTQDLSKDVLDTLNEIQQNNPQSKIAYSAVFRRKDSHELNAKVTQLNTLLAEELPLHGFDIIDNSNILFSTLKQDGLHLNSGGVRKFAGNLINAALK